MSCSTVYATETQQYTSGQVLDARKVAAVVGSAKPNRKRFNGSADYLTHKKGCLLAAAYGKGRPAAPCAALEDLASFLGTR
jgi:hypothetical protein